ncbi:MAG: pilus assembly protein TadG-related protein [Nakamurella sp.]
MMVQQKGSQSSDAGMATVFTALAIGVLILVAGIGLRIGGAVLARQQAETAADLGALAGAAHIWRGRLLPARAPDESLPPTTAA